MGIGPAFLLGCLWRLLLVAVLVAGASPLRAADEDIWPKVRAGLFGERPIIAGDGEVIELVAPPRAEDAATVPIVIRTQPLPDESARVEKIYLVVDRNPSPLGAIFTFARESGRAEVETRVRIEQYTMVRAIAEISDGRLYMASRFVKASGGCSAPAGKDQEAALARLGRIRLRVDEPLSYGRPNRVQLMISHPNNSGLAMDQVTRYTIPARFVRHVQVTFGGQPVMEADVDFTISENPNFRFYFLPEGDGELKAEVWDSSDAHFEKSLRVGSGAGQD